jgi:UDP-glucose 4-epimerase
VYADSKASGEHLARAHHADSGLPSVVARLFNTIGARQSAAHGMVLPRFVDQALAGADLTVHGDGSQTRCFCHVADTVAALLALSSSEAAAGGVYNVGSTSEISILALAERVIERLGSGSGIRFVPYEEAYGDGFEEPGRRRPDTAELQGLTGWLTLRTLDEAIDDVVRARGAEPVRGDASLAC